MTLDDSKMILWIETTDRWYIKDRTYRQCARWYKAKGDTIQAYGRPVLFAILMILYVICHDSVQQTSSNNFTDLRTKYTMKNSHIQMPHVCCMWNNSLGGSFKKPTQKSFVQLYTHRRSNSCHMHSSQFSHIQNST